MDTAPSWVSNNPSHLPPMSLPKSPTAPCPRDSEDCRKKGYWHPLHRQPGLEVQEAALLVWASLQPGCLLPAGLPHQEKFVKEINQEVRGGGAARRPWSSALGFGKALGFSASARLRLRPLHSGVETCSPLEPRGGGGSPGPGGGGGGRRERTRSERRTTPGGPRVGAAFRWFPYGAPGGCGYTAQGGQSQPTQSQDNGLTQPPSC